MTCWTIPKRHWWLESKEPVGVRIEAEATERAWARGHRGSELWQIQAAFWRQS